MILLYGIRDDREEFLFGDFLKTFFTNKESVDMGNQLFLACSRNISGDLSPKEGENTYSITTYKGYVQNMIRHEVSAMSHLRYAMSFTADETSSSPSSKMLICGNKSAMGKEVIDAMKATNVFGN